MTERIYPTMQKEEHHFSSDNKIKWWGYGEWVEEPDEIEFTYRQLNCRIRRAAAKEPHTNELHIFGGHLCGYVCIPINHPYHHKKYEDMDIICHYGLTFGQVEVAHWIGFDCGHSSDLIPSMQHLRNTNPSMREISEMMAIPEGFENSPLFHPTYKNVTYCIGECMDIVDQLIDLAKVGKS
jgi:hypothetical protein